ncbi:MAG: NADH-quinone oxidoreductase subunit NuoG [Rhodobacteraceae bacterium]|nr:NADH-quinone oxidoreductase subunit NuoG [Paracoccaceae bacterium]
MSDLKKIVIDGNEIEVDGAMTLIQACEEAGIEIPRFCYHERLTIAGNCRMCLVEVVGGPPKPAASCAMQVRDLRPGPEGQPPVVKTNSPMVKKAREGVMEFLLINHPLDCPICDQGGECDLQDQAMAYGVDMSRFKENKRSMDEIHLGPLIKTHMTRCIQCTRCVRFATEIAGVPEMGCTGRGEDAEIISYLNQALTSELQGNVIDLCPVGALTSRPYAFTARPWELRKTETIDVMDGLGANIRVDARGREVMRIMPREHADVNEEWISDKSRFVWDGLRRQRLDKPYVRGADGKLKPASWEAAFAAIAEKAKATAPEKIGAISGDLATVEAMFALKQLMTSLGVKNLDCRQSSAALPPTNPSAWLFNSGVAGVDQADVILLIGTNPRKESPVLNARLRRAWLNGAQIGLIGEQADLTYDYALLGSGPSAFNGFDQTEFFKALQAAERPLVIVGEGAAARPDGASVLGTAMQLAEVVGAVKEGWAGFSMLHPTAARVGGMAVGFVPHQNDDGALSDTPTGRDTLAILDGAKNGVIEMVYLLGADEIDMTKLDKAFVVYQGSHGDAGAMAADVILPGAAYTEESGLFVNTEGRPQLAAAATTPPGDARENWAILRALSGALGKPLPYNSLQALRAALWAAHGDLATLGVPMTAEWRPLPAGEMIPALFASPVDDFYFTNPIARASETMAELSKLAAARHTPMAAE